MWSLLLGLMLSLQSAFEHVNGAERPIDKTGHSPTLVAAYHVAIIMLEVTDASCDAVICI